MILQMDDAEASLRACVGNGNEAAPRLRVGRHGGNDGNAHSGSHHRKNGGELAALKDDVVAESCPLAGGDDGIAEAVAFLHQQETLAAELSERDGGGVCEAVRI